jgi:spore coat-associated protein N
MSKSHDSRRILIPLASLAAAAAIAIGSGATFSSQTENPGNSVASGTLTQSNSRANQAIFDLGGIKPGDTVIGKVTITNTGTLPAKMVLDELSAVNGFVDKTNLTLSVSDVTAPATPVQKWSGTFATLGSLSLGTWNGGEKHDYEFAVTLKATADNAEQGKSASAIYQWNGTQTAATTTTQP